MSKHVVVIGGGVIGLSTAWYCLRRGHRVTLIDRNPKGRDGCSFGNAGMIVPSHVIPLAAPGMIRLGLKWMWNPESPFYIRPRASWDLLSWLWQFRKACTRRHVEKSAPLLRELHFRSRQYYESLESELPGGFGLRKRGLLMLCKTQRGWDDEAKVATMARRLEVPAEVLDADATAALDPHIDMDVIGSVYYSNDCHLSPDRLMNSLERALANRGCEFNWETESEGFVSEGKTIRAIQTVNGQIDADEFILAGGVWSTQAGRELGVSLPMQAGKGYSVTLDKPSQLPELCSLLHEARVAVTPIGTSLRIGGTMEISGLDETVTDTRVMGIIKSFTEYFPAFDVKEFSDLPRWSGLRPCSPDGMPFLGRTNRWRNVIISTGHAMMGISLALVSGELAAQLVDGQTPEVPGFEQMSPDRYS